MRLKLFILISTQFLLLNFGYSQTPNHQLEYDIDHDGRNETFLFFDEYDSEFEKTEFTKFCIVDNNDSIWFKYDNVWVVKTELYASKANANLEDRIGLIKSDGNDLLWLTGFEYGCCYNKTTILKYENGDISELFNKDFEVSDIKPINGKKYLVGRYALMEQYGNMSNDYFFQSYFPEEYRLIDQNLKVDVDLTQEQNLKDWESRIIESVNVYNASIIILTSTNEEILVPKDLADQLRERRHGVTSLKKLNESFFEQYSKESLRLIRNEIFASRGYSFKSDDLNEYFKSQSWYKPTNKTADQVFEELTEIEKYNIELIQHLENNR